MSVLVVFIFCFLFTCNYFRNFSIFAARPSVLGRRSRTAGRERVVVRGTEGRAGCVGKLVTRRRSVVEKRVEVVASRRLRRRRWWRMLAGSGRLPRWRKGRTKVKGLRRPTKKEGGTAKAEHGSGVRAQE